MEPPPERPMVELTTATGFRVRVRQAREEDEDALLAGFRHLSEASRYARFFTAIPALTARLLETLTDLDGRQRVAIAAFDPSRPSEVGSPDGYGVGVARYIQADPDVPSAELAVTVIDEYQHQGVGDVLLTALELVAAANGIERLEAVVLTSNGGMTRLLQSHGAVDIEPPEPDPGVRWFAIDTSGSPPPGREALRSQLAPLAVDQRSNSSNPGRAQSSTPPSPQTRVSWPEATTSS
jgi:GNAT superfamily N-acetyltransferase